MPIAYVQALVPRLVVVDGEPVQDATTPERLAVWCLRLSPMTAADPPDGIWIDATGCTYLHSGERPMLSLLSERLA